MIVSTIVKPEDKEFSSIIHEAGELVKELTSLSRIEKGKKYTYDKTKKSELRFQPSSWYGILEGPTRWLWSQSHILLEKNILDLINRVRLVSQKLLKLAVSSDRDQTSRTSLRRTNDELYACVDIALARGYRELIKTYEEEGKGNEKCFLEIIPNFVKLKEDIKDISNRINHLDTPKNPMICYPGYTPEKKTSDYIRCNHEVMSEILAKEGVRENSLKKIKKFIKKHTELIKDKLNVHNQIYLSKDVTKIQPITIFSLDQVILDLESESTIPSSRAALDLYSKKPLLRFSCMKDDANYHDFKMHDLYLSMFQNRRGIVNHIGSITRKTKMYNVVHTMYTQYYNSGTLTQRIENNDLTEIEKHQIALDLLYGITEIHRRGYIHFNIHPDNIWINRTPFSTVQKKIDAALGGFNTISEADDYKSIKLERVKEFVPETDIWLLGHTLWYLYKGQKSEILELLETQSIFDLDDLGKFMRKVTVPDEPEEDTIHFLIWLMMCPNRSHRISPHFAIEEFEKVVEKDVVNDQIVTICDYILHQSTSFTFE